MIEPYNTFPANAHRPRERRAPFNERLRHPLKVVSPFINKNLQREYTVIMKYILFTGGGSAGHVVPNLAVMNELKYSHKIAYVGTGGIEEQLVKKYGYPFFRIDCPKLIRKVTAKNLAIPFRLKKAVSLAQDLLLREKPDLIFSKGGYASFPVAWAAKKANVPLITHESDYTPGLCTRMIAKRCKCVLTSFPETASLFSNGIHVSSPIRKELFQGDRIRARKKYSFSDEKPVLLVLGGGSGSRAINSALRSALPRLLKEWNVLHLCGKGNLSSDAFCGYVQREFEGDMASAYAAADVILARAGSNTVFELLALKKSAVFVPLEKSSRGDQLLNALYFQRKGLCRILREDNLTADSLRRAVIAALHDETVRANLQECSVENGTPKILSILKNFV